MQLACAIWLGSHKNKAKFPTNVSLFFQHGGLFRFVLVIKEHEKELLPYVEEAIKVKLKKELRLWKFEVTALNEELATEKKLVIREDVPLT